MRKRTSMKPSEVIRDARLNNLQNDPDILRISKEHLLTTNNPSGRKRLLIILILGAITAIGPLSIDMYLPGFSSIAKDFKISISLVGLSLTSYFIGISLGQLIYGPVTDRFGRKKPLIFGLFVYLVSAVGCALSFNIESLVVFRFFLAAGGCAGMVVSRAAVRDFFGKHESAGVFSSLMLVMGIAPIIAPTIGGFISANLGWRFIFVLLILFVAILISVVLFWLPESKPHDKSVSLKIHHILKEYIVVLKNRTFIIYTLSGGTSFAAMFVYIAAAPFVFIEHYGLSQTEFGILFGTNALSLIAGSQVNRIALKRYSAEKIIFITAIIQSMIVTAAVLLTITGLMNMILLIVMIVSYMFMQGFINPNTSAAALKPFERTAGFASALMGAIQMVIFSGVTALVTVSFNGTIFPMVMIMSTCVIIGFCIIVLNGGIRHKTENSHSS